MPSQRRAWPPYGPPRRLSAARPLAVAAAFGFVLALGVGAASPCMADVGGILAAGGSDNFRIDVLAFPVPLSVGPSDWSILVRDAETGRVRDDLRVEIRLRGEPNPEGVRTKPQTTVAGPGRHPGFYSARISLEAEGRWQGSVRFGPPEGAPETLDIGFSVREKKSPWQAHWGSLLLPFLLLCGFGWHQRRVLSGC